MGNLRIFTLIIGIKLLKNNEYGIKKFHNFEKHIYIYTKNNNVNSMDIIKDLKKSEMKWLLPNIK